ncbi:AraC family transcriptional regulator [Paenibacillus nanensis]|uniref:AraC family transcriptional regulator n=1 Tax=Paenibacillus nanensis TaxID=393251 RepID=A0A3A1UP04_9BACL|nr:AraC family transcriptional regulator [Paenibacillus nanensis]RIX50288.1 AraC family transcriptional regulator [Paenibacillus nanensis]
MKRMFDAVVFGGAKLFWDYRLHNTGQYKGYQHWHQCCEVLYVHEGTGHVVIGGHTFPLRRGMLFFFQPYQLHHVYADVSPEQPYTRTIFHFEPQFIESMLQPFPKRGHLFTALLRGSRQLQAIDLSSSEAAVERIYDDYHHTRKDEKAEDPEEIAMMVLRLLDVILSSTPSYAKLSYKAERQSTGYIQAAMQWIDEHYHESFHLDDLAEAMHLSKFYLSKLFHEGTGSTLKEYVIAKRIRQACRLLETTTKSVEMVGHEVGIPNPSYFVQLFKQEVGTTPLKYRTRFQQSFKKQEEAR